MFLSNPVTISLPLMDQTSTEAMPLNFGIRYRPFLLSPPSLYNTLLKQIPVWPLFYLRQRYMLASWISGQMSHLSKTEKIRKTKEWFLGSVSTHTASIQKERHMGWIKQPWRRNRRSNQKRVYFLFTWLMWIRNNFYIVCLDSHLGSPKDLIVLGIPADQVI